MTKIEKLEKALSEARKVSQASYAVLAALPVTSPEAHEAYRAWGLAQAATDLALKTLREAQDASRPRAAKRALVDCNTGRMYMGRVS